MMAANAAAAQPVVQPVDQVRYLLGQCGINPTIQNNFVNQDIMGIRTEQLRKLGKDYHMLPRLVQPNMGVFIRRGCETKQRCSNGTT